MAGAGAISKWPTDMPAFGSVVRQVRDGKSSYPFFACGNAPCRDISGCYQ